MPRSDVVASDTSEGEHMEDALPVRAFTDDNDNNTEEILLAEAALTNPAAFGELYERYYARVYRYIYHRVDNATDAEDITAAVFMKALEGLPGFQSRRNGFAPWIFRIARNSVVDYYRRRRQQTPYEDLDHETSDVDPMDHALAKEQGGELHRMIQYLSADQRDVVLMRYASDLSYEEIASALRKNEPAVRMLLHRGLRKLKAVMTNA